MQHRHHEAVQTADLILKHKAEKRKSYARNTGAKIFRPSSGQKAIKNTKIEKAFISPLALREAQARRGLYFAVVLKYFKNILSDFYQTNYLNIYRTDLHEICRIGRTLAVMDARSEVIFSIPQGTLPCQPMLSAESTFIPHLVVRMTFARAAPAAYDKKGNCYTGRRQTNHLTRWTHANQLTDQLTIINRRRGGKADGLPTSFALHLVHS